MQYFILSNLILLKNSTSQLEKLMKQWHRPFIINSFGRNNSALYLLKIFDRDSIPNMHYGNQLRIFYPQERYLCAVNEKPLVVIHNLHF